MKKLILCFALMLTFALVNGQSADTTKPQPNDLVIVQVSQVDFLLRRLQRLEESIQRLQEDAIELRNALNSIAINGWQRPTPKAALPKKEGKKE